MTGGARGRGPLRRAVALVVAVLAALAAGAAVAAPASAHAQYVRSDPADGATLPAAPRTLRIDLTQSVVPERTTLRLTDGSGRVTVLTPSVVPTDSLGAGAAAPAGAQLVPRAGERGVPSSVVATLPVLGNDVYRVAWSTLSADDLHTTSGVVVFGVGTDASASVGRVADPAPPVTEVVVRWLGLLAAACAWGGLAGAALLPGQRRRLLRLAAGGAAAGALLTAGLLVVQAGGPVLAADVLTSGRATAWWVRCGVPAATALLASVVQARRTAAGPVPALVGTALLAGTWAASVVALGHVGGGPLRLLADGAHVAAATTWLGVVLVGVLVAGRSEGRTRAVVRPLGALAAGCAAVMAVSGLLLASATVATWDALLVSTYGRFVLAKAALAVGVALAAAVTASRVHPDALPRLAAPLRRGRAGRTALGTVLLAEVLALAAVTALGAAAASSRPAVGPEWIPASAAVPLRSGQAADLVETVAASPNRPGRNFLTVDVYQTRRPAPGPVDAVHVEAVAPDGRRVRFDAAPQGDPATAITSTNTDAVAEAGRWLATTDALDEAGRWRLTVVAERDGMPAARATYDWVVVDAGARLRRPLLSSAPLRGVLDPAAAVLALLAAAAAGLALRRRRTARTSDGGDAPAAGPGMREADDVVQRWATKDGTVAVR